MESASQRQRDEFEIRPLMVYEYLYSYTIKPLTVKLSMISIIIDVTFT